VYLYQYQGPQTEPGEGQQGLRPPLTLQNLKRRGFTVAALPAFLRWNLKLCRSASASISLSLGW
jgi:hypothetical protein